MRLRSRLRKLVVLELVLRTIGVGTLLAISIRSVVLSPDLPTAEWIGALVLAALAYLALAFRTRAGADVVRRDLYRKEAEAQAARGDWQGAHPYRHSHDY